jgi:photosynthetic reaction center cytochrome c subunit
MLTVLLIQALGAMLVMASQETTERPAAARRPKLQVLTTVPESQLFPMMNAISDSLGVRCDYCHVRESPDPTKTWSLAGGWVWDRDDKPPKLAAREMMRMVLAINTQRFGGRMVVTCYTCHRGALAAGRFPPLPPRDYSTLVDKPAAALAAVGEVWSAYVRAVGEPAGGFSTTVLTATDERNEGRQGSLEVVFKGADRVRITSTVAPNGRVIQAAKGDAGWVASGNQSRALRADEIAGLRRAVLRYRAIKLDRPADLRIAGVERVRGRDAYVAVSQPDARTRRKWLFDAASGLLLRQQTTIETALIPLEQQIEYDDYRRVDGVMLPFTMRLSDGAPFDTSTFTFTSIRHNVEVDDSSFETGAQPSQAPQPPQTAGARYKSVRVLTGMPAAQMIPTMAFISNSLGVTCLHCHTEVYESDEKPAKQKAREMIAMTREINDTQFSGKRVMTCQTCHNGHAVPEASPVVENAAWNKPAPQPEGPLPDAATVLRRYAAAVGADALERLQNQRITGIVTRNSGRTAPASDTFELSQEKPRSMRLSTNLSHPPEADAELPMTFLRPPLLPSTYPDLRIVSRAKIGDDTIVVAAGAGPRGVHRLYFSESSGLLVRRSDEIETPLGAVPETYDFSDFKRVDGVSVPAKIIWSRADYQVIFAAGEIRHNVPSR